MKIIAIIREQNISFYNEKENKISFIKDFPLIFYFDKIENSFRNSNKYKIFELENNQNTFSDILISFSQNKTTNNALAKDYSYFIDKIFTEIINQFSDYENIEMIFSDSISESIKTKLYSFLSLKFKLSETNFILSDLTTKNFILKKQISTNTSDIVILDTSEQDLLVSKTNFDSQKISTISSQNFKDFLFDSSAYSISETILNDIQRIYNTKLNETEKKDNLIYIYHKILDKALEIEYLPKNFAVISTKLINSKERFTIRIDISKIKLQKQIYLKKIIGTLENKAQLNNNSRIILLGASLNKDELKNYFLDSFDHVEFATEEDIIQTRNDDFSSTSDEFSTMFMEASSVNADELKAENISTLDIKELEIGKQVKLTNYDPRPNKGTSTQFMEFLGNNKFVVVESTRSLKTGDIIEAQDEIWHSGIKLIFNVYRNGKLYGRFQTRELQNIEIFYEKN